MNNNEIAEKNFYNIKHWGEEYFRINSKGNIQISRAPEKKGVELQAIVSEAGRIGLHLPLLIRCTDILQHRVGQIYQAFSEAIAENEYKGSYKLVYPIKVNQEQSVVRELLKSPDHSIGLEAGSKPELMAVIGMLRNERSTIICNGYKDSGYIRIALIAQQMGHQVFIVIEKKSELDIILKESARMRMKPTLGVRIRLVSKCAGKWENSGGSKSKFGLNAKEVLELIAQLKAHDLIISDITNTEMIDDGTFKLIDLVCGDTITNVLNLAHFDTKQLIQSYEKQLIQAELPKDKTLFCLNELRSVFSQLTYLDSNDTE